jgi:hypothetical protein
MILPRAQASHNSSSHRGKPPSSGHDATNLKRAPGETSLPEAPVHTDKEERMRVHTIGRSLLLVAASVVAVATLVVSAGSESETPLDPQSLVGEWSGSWRNTKLPGANGQYQLTIDEVKGDKVYGQVVISGRETLQFKLLGTLAGNRLTFSSGNPTVLLIDGNQMRGNSQGSVRTNPMDIALTKSK